MKPATYTEDGHLYSDRTSWVYGLQCPVTQKIRYVGASVNPVQRYRAHVVPSATSYSTVRGSVGAKAVWIDELQEQGLDPELVILEEVAGHCETVGKQHPAVKEAEERWMVTLVRSGHPLTNTRLPADLKSDDLLFQEALQRGRELFAHPQD